MRQLKEFVLVMCLALPLLAAHEINATTCCTRHVTVDISGPAAEAGLATAKWSSLFSSEGGRYPSQCPILIVGPGGCIDYQFKGVLTSGPAGRLDMKLVDCIHNTVVKQGSITWPCASFPNSCPDVMMNFIVQFAAGFQPLDQIIYDYERIPERCEIELERQEVSPGQNVEVQLSDIVDAEGRKSKEVNRIVVYASNGEITGGTELDADPRFKAFRVGDGSIGFSYQAPDTEDNPGNEDDTIVVYNSCDILPEHRSPLSSTQPGDTIAEKTITMVKAHDADAKLTARCHSEDSNTSIDWEFTLKATFQYHDTMADEDSFSENYDVMSYELSDVSSTVIDKTDGSRIETHRGEINDMHVPDSMEIEFDARTGAAMEVNLPVVVFDLIFTGDARMIQQFSNVSEMNEVKTGDGAHELGGGGSFSSSGLGVTCSCEWSVHRHRRR